MLETKIEELTVAVKALTAALGAANAAAPAAAAAVVEDAPAATPVKRGRPAAKKEGPAHSRSEMQAAVNEVKEAFDTATAKALIKAAGFDKLADVTEDKFDELYDAAKAKLAETDNEDDDM